MSSLAVDESECDSDCSEETLHEDGLASFHAAPCCSSRIIGPCQCETCPAALKARSGSQSSYLAVNNKRGVEIGELFTLARKLADDEDARVAISSPGQQSNSTLSTQASYTYCLICGKDHDSKPALTCGPSCDTIIRLNPPKIVDIPSDHVSFVSVANQFKRSWRHPSKRCPIVRRVFSIIPPRKVVSRYEDYQRQVEIRGNFAAHGRSAGNENRRWHGTKRDCSLGERGQMQPCVSPTCSTCCIIRNSFDLRFFKGRTGWGRFGRGIYTSATSSKADDYSCNATPITSALRSMILAKVIVGRGCKMRYDDTSLTAAPFGYDSVLGERGARLNYDEVVVYTNEAIRPAYLVLYD